MGNKKSKLLKQEAHIIDRSISSTSNKIAVPYKILYMGSVGCHARISSCEFEDNTGNKYKLFNGGGQRSERKKWIQCLNGVHYIIFACSMETYCKPTDYDYQTLLLNDNLGVFEEMARNAMFDKTQIVILLNRLDTFRGSLKEISINYCFGEEYKGRNYNDTSMDIQLKVIKRLIKLICNEIDTEIMTDTLGIIAIYSDLWLDLVYKDGLQFISEKFLEIRSDAMIYPVQVIDIQQIQQIMEEASNDMKQMFLMQDGLL